jgi:hypothetical protein
MQATWFIALTLPYTVYRYSGDWWGYIRFLLPALPALIMLAAAALQCSWQLIGRRLHQGEAHARNLNVTVMRGATILLLLLSVGWTVAASYELSFISILRKGEKIYPDTAHWVRDHLPKNSLIACAQFSGAIYYYTNFPIVRWDLIGLEKRDLQKIRFDPMKVTRFDAKKVASFLKNAAAQNRPIYAVLWPQEMNDALRRFGGNWNEIAEIGNQRISVLQLVH